MMQLPPAMAYSASTHDTHLIPHEIPHYDPFDSGKYCSYSVLHQEPTAIMNRGNSVQRAVSAFFVGPHAENMHWVRKLVGEVLNEVEMARVLYAPSDKVLFSSFICSITIIREYGLTVYSESYHTHNGGIP